MRLLLAGLFIFLGLLVAVALLSEYIPRRGSSPALNFLFVLIFLVLLFIAVRVFNVRVFEPGPSAATVAAELKQQGLLTEEMYTAKRAFQLEESEDEGSHYFIELSDGSVLYLSGQYLYEYEPTLDDPELVQDRRFPCEQFTIRRHRTERYVVDMDCKGTVLQPEVLAPAFAAADFRRGDFPEDGDIITTATYDQVKATRVSAA